MPKNKRLIIDCTITVRSGLKTGVQKVVRSIANNSSGISFEHGTTMVPAIYSEGNWFQLPVPLAGTPSDLKDLKKLELNSGDTFLLADAWWSPDKDCPFDEVINSGMNAIFILYDLIPIRNPEYVNATNREIFEKRIRQLISKSFPCIAISNYVKNDFDNWILENKLAKIKCGVFRLGVDSDFIKPIRPEGEDRLKDQFLMVGSIEPRKGFMFVLEAFEKLWATGKKPKLVIVGVDSFQSEIIVKKIRDLHDKGYPISRLISIPRLELIKLMRTSTAVICASTAEGFGLPLLEAISLETPVIANNLPVFREVANEDPYYFNFGNQASFFEAIEACLENSRKSARTCVVTSWDESIKSLSEQIQIIFPNL